MTGYLKVSKLNELTAQIVTSDPAKRAEGEVKIEKTMKELLDAKRHLDERVCNFAYEAKKNGLLNDTAQKTVEKIIDSPAFSSKSKGYKKKDFTIQARHGVVQVNSSLLKDNSEVFKQLLCSSMKEGINKIVDFSRYSVEGIQLFIKCLQARSISEKCKDYPPGIIAFLQESMQAETEGLHAKIPLPADNALLLELVDLALTYNCHDLLDKIEPALTHLIRQKPDLFMANFASWLSLLSLRAEGYEKNSTVCKWMAEMTSIFLKEMEIDVPSSLNGIFPLSIEHMHLFFDEETKELVQHLPVALKIIGEEDFLNFVACCTKAKKNNPASIKLSYYASEKEKEEIRNFAKELGISVEFVNNAVSFSSDTAFFGKEAWEKYFGPVGDVPPPPDVTVKKDEMLVLIPATVDGIPLTLKTLGELVKAPKAGGHATQYRFVEHDVKRKLGEQAVPQAHWVLMSKNVMEGSRNKKYRKQQADVVNLAKATGIPYEVPNLLDAAVCIFTHYVASGERLFSDEPYTLSHCQDRDGKYQTHIGGFTPEGLVVGSDFEIISDDIGVATLQKFF